MSGRLLSNVIAFGRVLRGLELEAGPDRMIDLVHALDHVPIGDRAAFYHSARALFVRRREEIPRFDRAFEVFWRKPAGGSTRLDLRAMGERRRFRRPASASAAPTRFGADSSDRDGKPGQPSLLRVAATYSARELLRHKDFAEASAEELAAVSRMIAGLAWRIPSRCSRRQRPGRGASLDLRRTLRRSLPHGGEVLAWERREPRERQRPLVVLADISGSMERYTRLLLLFLHAFSERFGRRIETFAFGTRLTRITRQLSGRDPDDALAKVARIVPDWSGGTRIGETLHEFNFRWGRRVLSGGAVALLISDGWDRGDPELLSAEIARLQRSAYRLVWLNPLLGSSDYEPLARGMRAALPYVDDFLPVHSLASLEDLARRLEDLPAARPARRQHARIAAAASEQF